MLADDRGRRSRRSRPLHAPPCRAPADRAPDPESRAARASGSVERNTGANTTSSAPANARPKSSWKTRRHEDAERGSNTAQMRAPGFDARRPASVSATAVGWWAKSSYTVTPSAVPTTSSRRFTPANRRRPSAIRSDAHADLGRDGDRRQRVANVVRADERHLEAAKRRPAAPDLKPRRRDRPARDRRPASRRRRAVPNVSTRDTARALQRAAPPRCRRRGAAAPPRHEIDEPAERQRHGLDVGVDVRVIELDVVDRPRCPADT